MIDCKWTSRRVSRRLEAVFDSPLAPPTLRFVIDDVPRWSLRLFSAASRIAFHYAPAAVPFFRSLSRVLSRCTSPSGLYKRACYSFLSLRRYDPCNACISLSTRARIPTPARRPFRAAPSHPTRLRCVNTAPSRPARL